MAGKQKPIEPRFWANVKKAGPDDCWEWTASKTPAGYGKICVFGKHRMAHRVSFWMATGEDLDGGYYVCHRCDNPGCVNPAHLWNGDNSENISDAYSKGRMISQTDPSRIARGDAHPAKRADVRLAHKLRQQGEKSHRAKLTEAEAIFAHQMRADGMTHQKIADHFGITREAISCLLRGENWSHIYDPTKAKRHGIYLTINGQEVRLADAARQSGLSPDTIKLRIRNGMSHEAAISTPKRSNQFG